jgi:hypothetical protein
MCRRIVWLSAGALLLAVLGVGVYHYAVPADIALRVGMSAEEVHKQFGVERWCIEDPFPLPQRGGHANERVYFQGESNGFGYYRVIKVRFDKDDRLIDWDNKVKWSSRNTFLERAAKSIGW